MAAQTESPKPPWLTAYAAFKIAQAPDRDTRQLALARRRLVVWMGTTRRSRVQQGQELGLLVEVAARARARGNGACIRGSGRRVCSWAVALLPGAGGTQKVMARCGALGEARG